MAAIVLDAEMAVADERVDDLGCEAIEGVGLMAELVADGQHVAVGRADAPREDEDRPPRQGLRTDEPDGDEEARVEHRHSRMQQGAVERIVGHRLDNFFGRIVRVLADEEVEQRHEEIHIDEREKTDATLPVQK